MAALPASKPWSRAAPEPLKEAELAQHFAEGEDVKALLEELRGMSTSDIFDEGLHEFLTRVIDEVAGMLVTYLAVPGGVIALLGGFFWFRFFDILKPLGVRRLERLDGGLGIMADDLGGIGPGQSFIRGVRLYVDESDVERAETVLKR